MLDGYPTDKAPQQVTKMRCSRCTYHHFIQWDEVTDSSCCAYVDKAMLHSCLYALCWLPHLGLQCPFVCHLNMCAYSLLKLKQVVEFIQFEARKPKDGTHVYRILGT